MEHDEAQESTVNGRRTRSLGRFNLHTGEVIMPSWNKRTKEQKRASTYGGHDRKHTRRAHTRSTAVQEVRRHRQRTEQKRSKGRARMRKQFVKRERRR